MFTKPHALSKRSQIAVVAPAGRVKQEDLNKPLSWLESIGFQAVQGKHLYSDYFFGYHYAGDIKERLADLQWAISSPDIAAIWMARGGYGCAHLLDKLDLSPLKTNPKWICGYSDITVIHQLLQKNHFLSIHGPTVKHLSADGPSKEALSALERIFNNQPPQYDWQAYELNKEGEASGVLVGGNLSMIYSLIGTPYLCETKDKILFLEDWNENWYALDRMLMNLIQSGYFHGIRALILGSFTKMDVKDENTDYHLAFDPMSYEIIAKRLEELKVPIAFGFPAGHIDDNRPLVLGSQVTLTTDANRSTLQFDF